MRTRRARRVRETNAELNITAFMNLMVVLVPFLLITAVFSQISILNLNLPAGVSEELPVEDTPPKALEVIIRGGHFDVLERNSGLLKRLPALDSGELDFVGLNRYLQQVKAHPEFNTDTTITLLLEPDTAYDTLIKTMDAVRLIERDEKELDENGMVIQGELFPNISMGDAPPAETDDKGNAQGARQ